MNATEEWLRYIEDRSIQQQYDIKGYDDLEKEQEENTKESGSV